MSKPVILTGLRANNDLHIGNYLGALLPLVDMANKKAGEYQINLFVPDLHSFTTPIDHEQLQAQIMQNLRVFVAAGLDLSNPDINLYRQSYIPAHSELAVILNNFAYFGELARMGDFEQKIRAIHNKYNDEFLGISRTPEQELADKAEFQKHNFVSAGLFDYPVLMAADILLYGATYVPVGDDQTQHLEFTRRVAQRINKKFENLLVVPKEVKEQHKFFGKDQGLRVRDLVDPTKKMSKSDETGNGVIFLSDSSDAVKKKIMSSTTDSIGKINYDYDKQPGISNLLDIYKLLGGNSDEFIGQEQYGAFKSAVADKVGEFLTNFQAKLANVSENELIEKLESSEAHMNDQANKTLINVQKSVGLR